VQVDDVSEIRDSEQEGSDLVAARWRLGIRIDGKPGITREVLRKAHIATRGRVLKHGELLFANFGAELQRVTTVDPDHVLIDYVTVLFFERRQKVRSTDTGKAGEADVRQSAETGRKWNAQQAKLAGHVRVCEGLLPVRVDAVVAHTKLVDEPRREGVGF